MNWIERMYELKGKDLYSQNGEGLYLEYVWHHIGNGAKVLCDLGAGDGFYLSNTKHLSHAGWIRNIRDRIIGDDLTLQNLERYIKPMQLISIDIDGNDYWILDKILSGHKPLVIIAEFNPAFTDSRTIKYNPDHVWAGDDYYGFSFDAGVRIADKHGYKVIFQIADMNMIMVREDLIKVPIPPVTFKKSDYFKKSERTDWVFI
jgi:hypothetical protein